MLFWGTCKFPTYAAQWREVHTNPSKKMLQHKQHKQHNL